MQYISEQLLEGVCTGEGARNVLLDGDEESRRVLADHGEQQFEVAWMFEAPIIGLTGDGKEVLVTFLLHLHALVDGTQFLPPLGAQVLLLMGEQLQVLPIGVFTSSMSKFSTYLLVCSWSGEEEADFFFLVL